MKKAAGTRAKPEKGQGDAPKWRNRKLTRVEHVRAYVASLINRVESGQIEDQKAARLGNLANILQGLIQTSDLENRLARLEEQAREMKS